MIASFNERVITNSRFIRFLSLMSTSVLSVYKTKSYAGEEAQKAEVYEALGEAVFGVFWFFRGDPLHRAVEGALHK